MLEKAECRWFVLSTHTARSFVRAEVSCGRRVPVPVCLRGHEPASSIGLGRDRCPHHTSVGRRRARSCRRAPPLPGCEARPRYDLAEMVQRVGGEPGATTRRDSPSTMSGRPNPGKRARGSWLAAKRALRPPCDRGSRLPAHPATSTGPRRSPQPRLGDRAADRGGDLA